MDYGCRHSGHPVQVFPLVGCLYILSGSILFIV